MKLQVDIQSASTEPTPDEDDIRGWITAALETAQYGRDEAEISLRLVDTAEMTGLNQNYRGKAGPTNVLSFPSDLPAELELPLLGDIAICVPVVRSEAASQGKSLEAHWAHMAVHGTLHLLGYDHILEQEAEAMEAMESTILTKLNYPCPYRDDHTEERAAP
jgi:probable rRNA maturation factor